jgi:ABC-type Fe3+-hydroxamate transport system substrate-binding protein
MKYIDQLGNKLEISGFPKKIISTVPSQTELLAYFGLDDSVIGITKFCIHPEKWFRTKKRVGGTKSLNIELILKLKPDLIIANKEENDKAHIELLQAHFPVWLSDIKTLENAFEMITSLGEILNCNEKATALQNKLSSNFNEFKNIHSCVRPKVAYVIWNNPIMVTGRDTFINEMLLSAGFENIFSDKDRYPVTTENELNNLAPDFIFLSSEPFPFKEKHIKHFEKNCTNSKAILVDGELFSWYGSRLLLSVDYFKKLRNELLK